MLTPRPYLSFSQLALWEISPKEYAEKYLYGKNRKSSQNIHYGAKMAEGLENEEATGDPLLDLMIAQLPKFELMDCAVEDPKGVWVTFNRDNRETTACIPILKDINGDIPLLALPDTAKSDYSAFKEYKTSTQKWTQRKVDKSGQITFYATAIWLKTAKIPHDIELVVVQTEYDEYGALRPTGDLWRYPTKRTMADIIKMTSRMRKTWAGIKELCKNELL